MDGTEAVLPGSPSNRAFLQSSTRVSGSLEGILSQSQRLSELEGDLEIFQSRLISIEIRKPRLGLLSLEKDLEPGLCYFIPMNSVLSFL